MLLVAGHEKPFSIQLSHDRDSEEIDPSIKCQYILRENKKQLKLGKYLSRWEVSKGLSNVFP